jgi:subtilase family serine protease
VKRTIGVRLAVAVGVGALAVSVPLSSVAAAGSSAPASGPLVPVGHGITASALPGAKVFGPTPSATPEKVSFVLKERNLPQLKAAVEQGLHSFLSVRAFAQAYGQSPATIASLEAYLAQFGISTRAYADGIDVAADGTAGEFDRALDVTQNQYRVPAAAGPDGLPTGRPQTIHGISRAPRLPYPLAQSVLTVLGLTNYASFSSHAVHASTSRSHAAGAGACEKLSGLPAGCNLPTDFDTGYGLDPLLKHQATGEGQTLAIVTLATVDPGAPEYFWKHVQGLPPSGRTVTEDDVDGGSGPPSDAVGSGETDLDVEQSGGVAPGADVIIYQAPNTDAGFADAFFDAASQDTADTVSSSWGESETYVQAAVASGAETPAYEAAYDEAFLELAAQGQSTFLSAGDSGAYDASGDLGSTNLSVDTSADSPYVTAAGGTTLPWSGTFTVPGGAAPASATVPAQRAWGWDYLWKALSTALGQPLGKTIRSSVAGGGGGFSSVEPTPSYQVGVSGTTSFRAVENLTPTTVGDVGGIQEPTKWTINAHPPIVRGTGTGRALPDLSTDADPFSGYLLYEPSFAGVGQPVLQGGWGGTSFVAPQLNGAAAVIDSYLGHRVGLWNPSIYSFASGARSPFTPLQQSGPSNDNVYYTGNPGTLFNEATGLGVPNLTRLAQDFTTQG